MSQNQVLFDVRLYHVITMITLCSLCTQLFQYRYEMCTAAKITHTEICNQL